MFRLLASGLLFCASVAVFAQGPTPTVTPFLTVGDPSCGQFGVLSCPGSSANAQLTTADCVLDDGSFFDVFRFSGTEGQAVTIRMSSTAFDTFLFLQNPAGEVVAQDDDSGGALNSRLVFTLPSTGTWTVLANSFDPNRFGPYLLSLSCTGGVGVTATPLPGAAPADIPTLSLSAMLVLSIALAAGALAVIRRIG